MASSDSDHDGATQGAEALDALVTEYYRSFNERRLADAAALFTEDAIVEQGPTRQTLCGGPAYLALAGAWIVAFPDITVSIEAVVSRQQGRLREVALLATGTHEGALRIAGRVFKPTGTRVSLRARELLGFENGKVAFSSLCFELHELVAKLVRVDTTTLLMHLERLRRLQERLRAAGQDHVRSRELIDQIAAELDGARQVARPYFSR
jgi:hypothetical protein